MVINAGMLALQAVGGISGITPVVDRIKDALATALEAMAVCRKSCAVPFGVFKAMQVVTELALPKDVHIEIAADRDDADS